MKNIKLNNMVQTYLRLMNYDINKFTIPFTDIHDYQKQYLLYNEKLNPNEMLGISTDGTQYAWFDNENYNLPY